MEPHTKMWFLNQSIEIHVLGMAKKKKCIMPSKIGIPRPTSPSPISLHHRWSPSCWKTSSPPSSLFSQQKTFSGLHPSDGCSFVVIPSKLPPLLKVPVDKIKRKSDWGNGLHYKHCIVGNGHWASLRSHFYAKLHYESSNKIENYLKSLILYVKTKTKTKSANLAHL